MSLEWRQRVAVYSLIFTGEYPTPCGQELYQIAVRNDKMQVIGRTYEGANS